MTTLPLAQFDVFQEIALQLIWIAHNPALALVGLSCTCRLFYAWAQQYDRLWKIAHYAQFGTLEESVENAFNVSNMTWRSLVLGRLRILRSPALAVASWLAQNYKGNLGVNYSEAQLLLDAAKDGVQPCSPALLSQAFSTLISFYTSQIQALTGNEEDYFDSVIHRFKVSSSGRGPRTRDRYYTVERIGTLPAPFPKKATPTSVFTITIAALNHKSPKTRALEYFNGILWNIHIGLERLVHTTFASSVAAFPQDSTIPKQHPSIKHVLLPTFREAMGPELDISVPLSSVKWQSLFPENSLLGGDELLSAIRTGNRRRRTSLLFFHPGGDPRLSPLAWVQLTEELHEYSTLAYAFPADETYREGYDRTTFGAHHLDYIISVTLKSLRKYDAWRKSVAEGIYDSVGVERMVLEAKLVEDDARRLHEVLERMAVMRGKGAAVYGGRARIVGESLPNAY